MNKKCDCILPYGRMHGRENGTQVAPESDTVAEFGAETRRSVEADRTKSDMVVEVAHTIWRGGHPRIAWPVAQVAYASPRVGERDEALDRADPQAAGDCASRLDRSARDSRRTEATDAASPLALGSHDLSGVAASGRGCLPVSLRGDLLPGPDRRGGR